jgi:Cytidine and deoxycytidylate deaminase zinc-binding region
MGLAIAEARGNPAFPFGAVILRAADRHVMATDVNKSAANPTFHGEIVAINDYVARHGNRGWDEAILYTTGEPCPMCMSAMGGNGRRRLGHVDQAIAPIRHQPDPYSSDHCDRRLGILRWRDPQPRLAVRNRRTVPEPQAFLSALDR